MISKFTILLVTVDWQRGMLYDQYLSSDCSVS